MVPYAQRTVFEGREGKDYKFTRPTGEAITVAKIGDYYRMDSLERDFVASDGLHTMRFVLSPATWTFSRHGATYEGGLTPATPMTETYQDLLKQRGELEKRIGQARATELDPRLLKSVNS